MPSRNGTVREFRGDYWFLSNFYEGEPFLAYTYAGIQTVRSGEHLYQSMKCIDVLDAAEVLWAPTAGISKKRGRRVELRPDWEEVKLDCMRLVLLQKFSPGYEVTDKLLDTFPRALQEGNTWGDTFWGVDLSTGHGKNWLGVLLMERRQQLRVI